ncbi:ribonuclease III [Simkania negevensis]|uniref:Ribonuclease 3 n=1 Tax=Simkania negevensis (strain ATCC VR-1471 / DSM 27360 / Z) TaxID=331113 RepID=F8L6H5_SIMNZ|nr:ribonuclease III [Simkania negevensis]CCB88312.1 ribonuclease 3 [Simkania negevensis Z]
MQTIEELKSALSQIEAKVGYQFKDESLLERAFIHRSFINENRGVVKGHNERLEFLGDAVLSVLVSDFLYSELPDHPEGELSYLRSRLVEATTCAMYIEKLDVQSFILMGKGESMNQGKGRSTILADLFEALIGAIYLDGAMEEAHRFFFSHFHSFITEIIESPTRNWKAELQDYCQKNYQKPPTYEVINEEGPDHEKTFYVVVKLDNQILGKGAGTSKKEAEQMCAQQAIEAMRLE